MRRLGGIDPDGFFDSTGSYRSKPSSIFRCLVGSTLKADHSTGHRNDETGPGHIYRVLVDVEPIHGTLQIMDWLESYFILNNISWNR